MSSAEGTICVSKLITQSIEDVVTYTSGRGISRAYGKAPSKRLPTPGHNTGSSHRRRSPSEAGGDLGWRARLLQVALVVQKIAIGDQILPYATLEMALTNSPAYPVTTKSSSQKLRRISQRPMSKSPNCLLGLGCDLAESWRKWSLWVWYRERHPGQVLCDDLAGSS